MSNQNEIDEILNELKSKRENKSAEQKTGNKDPDESKSLKTTFDNKISAQPNKTEPKTESNHFNIINDSFAKPQNSIDINEIYTGFSDSNNDKKNKKKTAVIAVIAVLVIAVISGVIIAAASRKSKEEETTTETPTETTAAAAETVTVNPLTGETSYNESAVGKRPVACVVENASAARPQWGIDDSTSAPDIILEGEVEGGETRMLWFYADYTALPDQIGPIRSARPPYIRFSELFDSIFIHWGQSSSRDNYVGADTVFNTDNVDHINQMAYNDSVGLFGRDYSKGTSSEHTGVLYGNMLEAAIKEAGFRTDIDESSFTQFSFNDEVIAVGTESCTSFSLTFSSNTKTRDWTYTAEDKMYHCTDYETDVTRTNLLVLYDQTKYITKYNYKGTGNSETYCDYKLSGGSGKLVSYGTATDIIWSVENGVLVIKDASGNTVNLNPGKTWIGYASSNHGGTDTNNSSAE